ncbi:unnamed protein product [Phytophthora fragariaefolia]|uniref:Unnamed protein product n=1 Tax=Phytophthora fragariaefolia TaxID=1490495 RepID=A0A9W7CQZ8_9STRA|nr:unnamed protein product [Phytophthora fragariaefolia]
MISIMDMHYCESASEFLRVRDAELTKWHGVEGLTEITEYFYEEWLASRYCNWQFFTLLFVETMNPSPPAPSNYIPVATTDIIEAAVLATASNRVVVSDTIYPTCVRVTEINPNSGLEDHYVAHDTFNSILGDFEPLCTLPRAEILNSQQLAETTTPIVRTELRDGATPGIQFTLLTSPYRLHCK